MQIRDGFLGTIGNTPLIKLRKASEETGCTILGKAEFLNPGGSVKDRAAYYIIRDAEEKGLLQPRRRDRRGHRRQYRHRPRAGRKRHGLPLGHRHARDPEPGKEGHAAAVRRRSPARARRALCQRPNNYVKYSGRLAEELAETEPNGAIWANQFDNVANRMGHFMSTGPEIWTQTDGKVDGFICAVGTGGTLAGTAMVLKERNPDVKIGLADPGGAALYNFYKTGELKPEGTSITEGIGTSRITKNLEGAPVDFPYQIPDEEALPVIFDLLIDEGLCVGGSTGINVAGAIRLAKELGPGKTIVTILCDYGTPLSKQAVQSRVPEIQGPARRPPGWTPDTRDRPVAADVLAEHHRFDRLAGRPSRRAGRPHRRRLLVPAGRQPGPQDGISRAPYPRRRVLRYRRDRRYRQRPAPYAAERREVLRPGPQARPRRWQPDRRL